MGWMECLDLKMFHLKSLWTIQVELPGVSLLCGGDLLKEDKDKINIWELSLYGFKVIRIAG